MKTQRTSFLGFDTTNRELLYEEIAELERDLCTAKEALATKNKNVSDALAKTKDLELSLSSARNTINQLRQSNDMLREELARYKGYRDKRGRFAKKEQ